MPQMSSPTTGSLKQGSASKRGAGSSTGNSPLSSGAAAAEAAALNALDFRLLAFFRATAAAVREGAAWAGGTGAAAAGSSEWRVPEPGLAWSGTSPVPP
eukprot:11197405-Heterocapsa_arctica.AAC.1